MYTPSLVPTHSCLSHLLRFPSSHQQCSPEPGLPAPANHPECCPHPLSSCRPYQQHSSANRPSLAAVGRQRWAWQPTPVKRLGGVDSHYNTKLLCASPCLEWRVKPFGYSPQIDTTLYAQHMCAYFAAQRAKMNAKSIFCALHVFWRRRICAKHVQHKNTYNVYTVHVLHL